MRTRLLSRCITFGRKTNDITGKSLLLKDVRLFHLVSAR